MRILFVSGTHAGGAAKSTHQLARRLEARGHTVGTVVRVRARPRPFLITPKRRMRRGTRLARGPELAVAEARRRLTRRARRARSFDYPVWVTSAPERALPGLCAQLAPEIVVANSLDRRAWPVVHDFLAVRGIMSVLYVREDSVLEYLRVDLVPPDLLLTNATSHAEQARRLGLEPVMVPSVVELGETRVESTREVALFVNPVRSRGLDVAIDLATRRPDVPFVFQESWLLDRHDLRALRERLQLFRNVTFRPYAARPADVYRDARVLLLPYHGDNRPRVIAEAQANGIPVLASDGHEHREAVGPGGVLVAVDSPPQAWEHALSHMWDDDTTYRRLSDRAREHARRPDLDPDATTQRFEDACARVIGRPAADAASGSGLG